MKIISNKETLTIFIFFILILLGCKTNFKNNFQINSPYYEIKDLPASQRCDKLYYEMFEVFDNEGFYNVDLLPDWAEKCETFVADSFGGGGMLNFREQLEFQNEYFRGMMKARERGEIEGDFFSVPNYDIYYYNNHTKTWIKTNISVNMTEYSRVRNDSASLDVWLKAFKEKQ